MMKKDSFITVVNNGDIYFLKNGQNGELNICYSLSLERFYNPEHDQDLSFFHKARNKKNDLLICPYYWIGYAYYRFQSGKRRLAEEFIRRKLKADYPEIPDVEHFFEYSPFKTDKGEQFLHVYFLHEPEAITLYQRLKSLHFAPLRITSPALVWEQKLKSAAPDFDKGGKGLIHIVDRESYLYFFYHGKNVFSRTIPLAHEVYHPEILEELIFEINQSAHLFSQKTRSEVELLYLVSDNQGIRDALKENQTREIRDLPDLELEHEKYKKLHSLGPSSCFNGQDLTFLKRPCYLSHVRTRAELEWKGIQKAGMAIGIILLLLVGGESFFIRDRLMTYVRNNTSSISLEAEGPEQKIREYNDALDLLIKEWAKPDPGDIVAGIIRSLPKDFWIREVDISDGGSKVNIKVLVKAPDALILQKEISSLVNNLNKYLHPQPSVCIRDVRFSPGMKEGKDDGLKPCIVCFRLDRDPTTDGL